VELPGRQVALLDEDFVREPKVALAGANLDGSIAERAEVQLDRTGGGRLLGLDAADPAQATQARDEPQAPCVRRGGGQVRLRRGSLPGGESPAAGLGLG
jgi:hypothetical protein